MTVDLNGHIWSAGGRGTDEARLALCDPAAVPRFRSALVRVLAYGEHAYIERDPWRSAEQQREKVEHGYSRTLKSAHCHVDVAGHPASRAVHIIGPEFYTAQFPFWLHVGAAAVAEGLIWGGLYPPKDSADKEKQDYYDLHVRPELRSALMGERWHEAEIVFAAGRRLDACWDPAHVEWRPPR